MPTTTTTELKTKAEVDPYLGALIKGYTSLEAKVQSYWLQIVQYVKKNRVNRRVLIATLMHYRRIKRASAENEASMVLNAAGEQHTELFRQALDGKITVRNFRHDITKKQEVGAKRPKSKLRMFLLRAVVQAIDVEKLTLDEFKAVAGEVYAYVQRRRRKDQMSEKERNSVLKF